MEPTYRWVPSAHDREWLPLAYAGMLSRLGPVTEEHFVQLANCFVESRRHANAKPVPVCEKADGTGLCLGEVEGLRVVYAQGVRLEGFIKWNVGREVRPADLTICWQVDARDPVTGTDVPMRLLYAYPIVRGVLKEVLA